MRTKHRPPKHPNVLPGFGLSLGYTLMYLGLIVLLPLSAAFIKTAQLTWPEFIAAVSAPRVVAKCPEMSSDVVACCRISHRSYEAMSALERRP